MNHDSDPRNQPAEVFLSLHYTAGSSDTGTFAVLNDQCTSLGLSLIDYKEPIKFCRIVNSRSLTARII